MKLDYVRLLGANELIRKISDTTYWLCITRTVQESKLFPVPSYMLLSYLNAFYRWPELLRKVERVISAEECGDRAREASLKLNTVNAAWCLPAFYLLGRELLMALGLLRNDDAAEDVAYVMDFTRRFNLAYHRGDAHLTNKDFGDRSQLLPERTLQVFEADLFEVQPGDRLHTAATQLTSQLAQYSFLAHCECRIGIHNSGPYRFGDGRELLVRDWFDLAEGDYPWLDGIATGLPHNNLSIPVVLCGTHFHLVDDWGSFECEPAYSADNVVAVGLYTSDALTEGYQPVAMEDRDTLAATMERYRDIVKQATADLWKRIAGWSRDQMMDGGALVYSTVVKDFAHLAGIYDPAEWMCIDERAARFKPMLNDEYGRDALGELVGLLSVPTQQVNEYSMARTSNAAHHMMSALPYSVLAGGGFAPGAGPLQPGSSSLPPKTGAYTTSRGRLELAEYNRLAADFRPRAQAPEFRYLDDEWVKSHWRTPQADALYRLSQEHSRSLRGQGAGLRRADLARLKKP
ncbi:MAG: hypothetical protein ISP90_05070 [Nevskia sp.]|nr:hypothetical protein [Nevskia sp.]